MGGGAGAGGGDECVCCDAGQRCAHEPLLAPQPAPDGTGSTTHGSTTHSMIAWPQCDVACCACRRYAQHTEQCHSCQKALKGFQKALALAALVQRVAGALALLSLAVATACYTGATAPSAGSSSGLVGAALQAAAAVSGIGGGVQGAVMAAVLWGALSLAAAAGRAVMARSMSACCACMHACMCSDACRAGVLASQRCGTHAAPVSQIHLSPGQLPACTTSSTASLLTSPPLQVASSWPSGSASSTRATTRLRGTRPRTEE